MQKGTDEGLLHLLRDHGYPEDSIVLQSTFLASTGKWFAPDVVIVDPKTKEHLAVFETKKLPSEIGDAAARAIVKEYAASRDLAPDVPLYVIDSKPNLPKPVLYRVKESGLEPLPAGEFPTFKALAAHRVAASKDALAAEKVETTDALLKTSWWLAGAATAIGVLDVVIERVWSWQLLSPPRLAVAGVVVLLLVLPHATKLKALGVEWERRHGKASDGDS